MPAPQRLAPAEALSLLTSGAVEVEGRMPWSSNATFLVTVTDGDGRSSRAVYKPGRGERPLWDFPGGLYKREVAAYVVSDALGWGLVPETVLRDDAPMGRGSLQRFVDADFEQHYFSLFEDESTHDALRRIALFDLVVNNTDRKSGHCLRGEGRIWAIDNGLCFHVDPKLRTVIWEFAGTPVPAADRADVARFATDLPAVLGTLLGAPELAALARRAAAASRLDRFPDPGEDYRSYPWPLV